LDGHNEARKDFVALQRPFDFQTLVSHQHILGLRDTFLRLGPLLQEGRMEEAAVVEADILQKWGLPQLPVWVPKHTRIGKGRRSTKKLIRF
jgi:hypothetical protein